MDETTTAKRESKVASGTEIQPPITHDSADEELNRNKSVFEKDGFLVSRQLIPTTTTTSTDVDDNLAQWQKFAKIYFQECFVKLHKSGHTAFPSDRIVRESVAAAATKTTTTDNSDGKSKRSYYKYAMGLGGKNGFREIVMRSPGRYEISLLECSDCPPIDAIKDALFPLVPTLLGASQWEDLKMCHLSLVISTPESTEQSWHADGGHVSVTEHLPCHVANVFIPLQDIPMVLGPTEFRPGTHVYTRNLAPMMLAARARKQLRPPVTPKLQLGDALVFDYRVLHRGKANLSSVRDNNSTNRAILVMTFCKPWYKDIVNFPSRSMFDPLCPTTTDA